MSLSTIFLSTLPCALPFHLRLPKTSSRCSSAVSAAAFSSPRAGDSDASIIGTLYPSLPYSSTLYFKSTYNVQIIVNDDEPEDKLINRFRKEVLKAGVLQECRRRRFFENKHDKIKRKAREASRRNRKRQPQSRTLTQNNLDSSKKKKGDDEDDDNWDLPEVDIPYS